MRNQRLLISVFDSQEAREAILGGARVIDCEDPAGALGDIAPRRITTIADSVVQYKRNLEVQISTNIGENQLLFKRDDKGRAVQRFPDEIAGKASQNALGVASAMGTDAHPSNIIKVGLDGMPRDIALATLKEVVATVKENQYFGRSEVVGVFFAQDLKEWQVRQSNKFVIRDLLLLREYVVDKEGDINIDELFADDSNSLKALKEKLASDPTLVVNGKFASKVRLTQLNDLKDLGYKAVKDERFEMSFLFSVADLVAEAGADGVMIDTRIHTKVAYICCLNHKIEEDVQAESKLKRHGIYTLEETRKYVCYCHEKGIQFWASGTVLPQQAQPLWALKDDNNAEGIVDAMAVRTGASGAPRVVERPGGSANVLINRASKRIYRDLVAAYAPPKI